VDGASIDATVFAASNFSMKASMEACDGAVENARDARETTDIDRLARASARREDAIVVVVVVVCRARAGRGRTRSIGRSPRGVHGRVES